jgi:hypothetical protein
MTRGFSWPGAWVGILSRRPKELLERMASVADDFRLTVEFEEEAPGFNLGRFLQEHEIEDEVREQLGRRVVVTHDGPRVFLYTATEKQAEVVEQVVRKLLTENEMNAKILPLVRWHPIEERWVDASVPLPGTKEEIEAEHERWEQRQARESQRLGYAEWEVRVDLPTHRDAVELAQRLEEAGIGPIVRRWKYLLIGTANDDEARVLAERLRSEAPQAASVKAEPSWTIAWEFTGRNPFATFGALGPGP